MISSDRDILISITEILSEHAKEDRVFRQEVLSRIGTLETSVRDLSEEVHIANLKIENMQLYGGLILGAITLMVTVSTVIVPLLAAMLNHKQNSHHDNQGQTIQPVQPVSQPVYIVMPSEIRPVQSDSK